MAERSDMAVATYLGKSVEGLTLGENLFHGPPFEIGGLCVFCVSDSGFTPQPVNGTETAVYRSAVTIRVRGERTKYNEGLTFAKSIQTAIQFSGLGTDYIMTRVENSSPAYLGQTKDGAPEWVIFCIATFKE